MSKKLSVQVATRKISNTEFPVIISIEKFKNKFTVTEICNGTGEILKECRLKRDAIAFVQDLYKNTYRHVSPLAVPSAVCFQMPDRCKGQIVDVEYGFIPRRAGMPTRVADRGDPWKRVVDKSEDPYGNRPAFYVHVLSPENDCPPELC